MQDLSPCKNHIEEFVEVSGQAVRTCCKTCSRDGIMSLDQWKYYTKKRAEGKIINPTPNPDVRTFPF